MSISVLSRHRRLRDPGSEMTDRRALELAGWRTLLDYSENQVRRRDGRLVRVEPRWTAEAELGRNPEIVAVATAPTIEDAWAQLRAVAAAVELPRSRNRP